jgi:hypothetical protein
MFVDRCVTRLRQDHPHWSSHPRPIPDSEKFCTVSERYFRITIENFRAWPDLDTLIEWCSTDGTISSIFACDSNTATRIELTSENYLGFRNSTIGYWILVHLQNPADQTKRKREEPVDIWTRAPDFRPDFNPITRSPGSP